MQIANNKLWAFVTEHVMLVRDLADNWGHQLNFEVEIHEQFDNLLHTVPPSADSLWVDANYLIQLSHSQNIPLHDLIPATACSLDIKLKKSIPWVVMVDNDLSMEDLNMLLSCESQVLAVVHVDDLQDTTKALQVLIHVINHIRYVSEISWTNSHTHDQKHVHIINDKLTPIMLQLWNNKLNPHTHVQFHLHRNLMDMITHMWHFTTSYVHVICVHEHHLQDKSHTHALDRIKMIQVASQLYHEHTHLPLPTLYVDVDTHTDLQFIKMMLSVSDLNGITQLNNHEFSVTHASVMAMVNSVFHVPAPIKLMLDNKKSVKKPVGSHKVMLTPREQQILHIICDKGHSNKMIANDLKLSESAVKLHIGNILKKYNVRNRTQLALCAQQQSNP